MPQITAAGLTPAKEKMIECGFSPEQAAREIGFAMHQILANKDLKNGNPVDLNNAVCQAAYTGLTLNHTQQEAALTAYNERGQRGIWFLPMYRGLRKIALAQGAIIGDNTQVIFEGDEWTINAGKMNDPVDHIIKSTGKSRKPVLCYTVNRLPSGLDNLTLFYYDEYLKLQDAAKRKMGDKYKYSPHAVWSDQMYKKSCFKRSLTNVSGTGDAKISHALHLDNMQYDVYPLSVEEPKLKPEQPKKKKVNSEPELPEMNQTHPNYLGCVKAICIKTQTFATLRKHFDISPEMEERISLEAITYIPKEAKTEAA